MDTGKIFLPPNIALPCKLKWAVDNNSIVSSNQIIAFVIETGQDRTDAERTGDPHTERPLIGEPPTEEGSSQRGNFHLGSAEAEDAPYGKSRNGGEEEGAAPLASQNGNSCENAHTNVVEEVRSSLGDHYAESPLRRDAADGVDKDAVDGVASQGTFPNKETTTDTRDNLETGSNHSEERRNESANEKNNFINLILSNKNNFDIKKDSYVPLRSSNHGRIRILKQNPFLEKDEYIYISSPNELLCEISDERCNHEVIFSGLCTNCFLNQEEINKNKKEQKYFLSPGFLTNEKELYINTDKVIDLEKERISNIIRNRKLCLVLDLDNTLLHASFFVISINMNSEVINITTDIDEELAGASGGASRSGVGSGGAEDPAHHRSAPREADLPLEEECGAANSKKEDNVRAEDGADVDGNGDGNGDVDGNGDGNGDADGSADGHADGQGDGAVCPKVNPELYSLFCQRKNNGVDHTHKYQDIKSSYENYCDFLAKMNTINLLKHNGKFIHYENLKDKNIKKKIDKLEQSVLKTNVKHHKGSYTIYYKLRPGVIQFLQKMNKKYEIYLYTMGTLEHAKSCLLLLDPLKNFFGNRVFSRKDSVNGLKHLNRILPTYRSVSLCIDDSDYMWKESSSCIKVHGYNYFPEINFLEDIKRKPYFLTKFFAMAQSYLNFSSNLYGFINFKCSEYERMRIHRFNSVLYSECSSWGGPYNGSMALGGAYQVVDQGSAEEAEDGLCEGEEVGVATEVATEVAAELADGVPPGTSCGDSSQVGGYHYEGGSTPVREDGEDALVAQRGNPLSGNGDSGNGDSGNGDGGSGDELDESFEDSFIDLDKEFETDSEEGDVSVMDPKVENSSCDLSVQNGLEFFDDANDFPKGKEAPLQHFSEEHVASTFITGTQNGVVKRDHLSNLYPNDGTYAHMNNPNWVYVEKGTSENVNKNFPPQSDNNFFVNADGLKGTSPTSSAPLNGGSCAADLFQSGVAQLAGEEHIPMDTNLMGTNLMGAQFETPNHCEDKMNRTNDHMNSYISSNSSSYVNMNLHISKHIDKKKNKKKKKKNANGEMASSNAKHFPRSDGEYSQNQFDHALHVRTPERFIPFEDEIIYKFISERNFRKYDNYVVGFLRSYFRGGRLPRGGEAEEEGLSDGDASADAEEGAEVYAEVDDEIDAEVDADVDDDEDAPEGGEEAGRENPPRSHRGSRGDAEIKTEGEDHQLGPGDHLSRGGQDSVKRVEKKIKKTKVKKLIHFGNLRKRNSTNFRTDHNSDDPGPPTPPPPRDSDQNIHKHGASNQNEYYESFCIPKNFNEGNFKDNDKQLHYLTAILDEIHHIFYQIFEHFKIHKTNERNEEDQIYNYFLRYPIVRTILIEFRRHVLKDCTFNVSQLSDEIRRSDFMDHILKLGGSISNDNYTHILTVNNFLKNENWEDAKVTNLMWIERALYTWTKVDTKHYDMSSWGKTHRNFWDVIEYEEKKKKKMK
ncbi:hypothetical protein, conserved [Plasmodium vivax]|uniref:protein-serine/threonine phosphatase n=2 Tax=Plasmodium vivax TaxID=5855 RepID=A5K7F2_PLAVS|nr:hypothetical protein, conserved [Plasmodium vivax]EDL44711.1 hypothetical protein, conserved [Plasmodium vivax]KMZ93422.1 hypothetical protein PVMG_00868 [Plasmodium vivax Mauritania I]|eukprot:XP_001614438.1 hypothetical protein [Plasmodium vivax Sal-1]